MKFLIILLVASLVAAVPRSEKEEREEKRERTELEERGFVDGIPMPMPHVIMDVPEIFNSSQCIFKPEEKVVSCRRAAETVECPAVCDTSVLGADFEKRERKFNVWGIGVIGHEERIENVRYWLYPRRLDNSSYLNHTYVADNGRVVDLVIGCGERFVDVAGLRITDCKCYERLVRVFDESSRRPHMSRLESEPTVVEEIPLIGEVLVLDKHVQKRWLWGYGWGGYYGWGWAGYPYYGYGWGWGK